MHAGSDTAIDGLRVRALRVRRGERLVLSDVAFDAPRGAVTVVVAPSGSGKSTLLRCLTRLLEPEQGEILLDGAPIARLPATELRRRVGLSGQVPFMLPGTVRENLAYSLAAPLPQARARAALRSAGLDETFLDRPAAALSGGERARVALARALTRDPEMLVLDEPTAALDVAAGARIAATLGQLAHGGLGVVVATHDLDFAAAVADRAVALDAGVGREDDPATVLARARRTRPGGPPR